jgi:hypothetical protein
MRLNRQNLPKIMHSDDSRNDRRSAEIVTVRTKIGM